MKHESKKWYRLGERFYYYKVDANSPDLEYEEKSFGIDLYCAENKIILPTEQAFISQGIVLKGNTDVIAELVPRSSMPKRGLILANSVGIIDAGYEGEGDVIKAFVWNIGKTAVEIKKGERIVQLIFKPRIKLVPFEAEKHWGSENRGGFGSTGA